MPLKQSAARSKSAKICKYTFLTLSLETLSSGPGVFNRIGTPKCEASDV